MTERVQQRVKGRKMAFDLVCLLDDAERADRDYVEAMQAELERLAPLYPADVLPDCTQDKPTPIARLAATVMPFGAHKDKALDDVPLEYLDWLCRSQEEFYKSLREYLKHPELESRRQGR